MHHNASPSEGKGRTVSACLTRTWTITSSPSQRITSYSAHSLIMAHILSDTSSEDSADSATSPPPKQGTYDKPDNTIRPHSPKVDLPVPPRKGRRGRPARTLKRTRTRTPSPIPTASEDLLAEFENQQPTQWPSDSDDDLETYVDKARKKGRSDHQQKTTTERTSDQTGEKPDSAQLSAASRSGSKATDQGGQFRDLESAVETQLTATVMSSMKLRSAEEEAITPQESTYKPPPGSSHVRERTHIRWVDGWLKPAQPPPPAEYQRHEIPLDQLIYYVDTSVRLLRI